jgi:hypothetical protein
MVGQSRELSRAGFADAIIESERKAGSWSGDSDWPETVAHIQPQL